MQHILSDDNLSRVLNFHSVSAQTEQPCTKPSAYLQVVILSASAKIYRNWDFLTLFCRHVRTFCVCCSGKLAYRGACKQKTFGLAVLLNVNQSKKWPADVP